jgi:hypothetical protein
MPESLPTTLPVAPNPRVPAVAPAKVIARDPALNPKSEIPVPAILPPPPTVAALPTVEASTPSQVAPLLPEPKRSALTEFSGPDVAVILARNQFYPSTIRLRSGSATRLLFTTVNRKPGALILERLEIQRWIPGDSGNTAGNRPMTEAERARSEVDREVTSEKITEVLIDPKPGSYGFYDALSGATGEIVVE